MKSIQQKRHLLLISALFFTSYPQQSDTFSTSSGFYRRRNARCHHPGKLSNLFASTQQDKINASSKSQSEIEQLIVQFGRKGQTDRAVELYRQIDRPTIRQMNAVLDACARAKPARISLAFEILQSSPLKPNVYTFGALMNGLARSQNVDQAIQLLDDMQETYQVKPNGVVYNAAISACARANPPRLDTALSLLQQARREKIHISAVGYNAAVSAAARAEDWEQAIAILDDMEANGPAPDHVTYSTVMFACERAGQWQTLLDYASRMRDRKLEMDALALTSVLHACQQLGMASEALQYLELMKTAANPYERQTAGWQVAGSRQPLLGPDAVAYRLTISACARGGAWMDGIRILEEYCREMDGGDVVAYTAAITGCEYAGEWRHAFVLLERMRQAGIEPNEVTFAAIIGACATACAKEVARGDIEKDAMPVPQTKALRLLNVLKKDPSTVDPNTQIYNAAIKMCAEALDLNRAFQLYDDLKEQGLEPNEITYGSLMTACERVGSLEGLSRVFRSLRADEIEPNEIIYGAAISCCRKASEPQRAMLLLKKMIQDGLEPNVATFNTVLTALMESKNKKDTNDAIVVYKLLQSSRVAARPSRQTYNILIHGLAQNQQGREAETFLRQMRSEGLVPDVHLYTSTVSAYERSGQPLQALRLMESMRTDGYDFYEIEFLNKAFKKAVRLANVVGRGWAMNSTQDDWFLDLDALERLNQTMDDGDVYKLSALDMYK